MGILDRLFRGSKVGPKCCAKCGESLYSESDESLRQEGIKAVLSKAARRFPAYCTTCKDYFCSSCVWKAAEQKQVSFNCCPNCGQEISKPPPLRSTKPIASPKRKLISGYIMGNKFTPTGEHVNKISQVWLDYHKADWEYTREDLVGLHIQTYNSSFVGENTFLDNIKCFRADIEALNTGSDVIEVMLYDRQHGHDLYFAVVIQKNKE